MKKKIVIGIGEILWDLLPDGKQLGGAPANFVWHAQQLGAEGTVVSAVGDDELGDEIRNIIKEKALGNGISVSEMPTGTVSVELRNGIPDYIIHENVAWDFIELNDLAREKTSQAEAICFGSLAQRSEVSAKNIRIALDSAPDECLKIFDINLRQAFYSKEIIEASLKRANVFKINDEELFIVREMFGVSGTDQEVCRELMELFDLKLVALTGGEEGSMLISKEEKSEIKTPKVEVADTIGAGDSFSAALAMGMLEGLPLKKIHSRAVTLSAFVCTQNGATPVIPNDLFQQALL
jgi:fructokinase